MGGLIPKAPKPRPPQVVRIAAPAPQPSIPPAPTPEELAAEQRRKTLLGRDRGRFGTIQTGFRGLLDLATFGARKTLLGE